MATWLSIPSTKLKRYSPYLAIFTLALVIRTATAWQLAGPEGLDAEYYFLVAQNLVRGKGLIVDAIWHFLDNSLHLPHPAGEFWLLLPSLIQALGLLLGSGYRYAQMTQVIMSSALVALAFRFGRQLTNRWSDALLAAFLTLFGGFSVMVRQVDLDCYATYALAGGMALYAMYRGQESAAWLCASGFFSGLASLTRNDGIFLLLLLLLYLAWLSWQRVPYSRGAALVAIALYLALMIPWWIRNWVVFGRPSPVPILYPALLREYHELFTYQAQLTWEHFLSWGWQWQLRAKLIVAVGNAARFAWMFQLWQVPLLAVGIWTVHRRHEVLPMIAFPLLLYLALSLVYTFPSEHGSWLHSLSAFVPFGAAFSALGLHTVWQWLTRHLEAIRPSVLLVAWQCTAALLACLGGMAIAHAEIASNRSWTAGREAIAAWITAHTSPQAVIMASDPLGVTLASGRSAVAIPNNALPMVLQVADQCGAQYLVLWNQRSYAISRELFSCLPAHSRLHQLSQWEGVQIYGIEPVQLVEVYE